MPLKLSPSSRDASGTLQVIDYQRRRKVPAGPSWDSSESDDKPHEECGVFGINAPGEDVARLAFFAMYALQHRGQESAGIATSDGQTINLHTSLGLVAQGFDESDLSMLTGHLAVGHTRYSTAGSNSRCNSGPMYTDGPSGEIVVAHNGNLTNAVALRLELEESGEVFQASTDSEVLTRVISTSPGITFVDRIRNAIPRMIGAFSLAILHQDQLYAVRDPLGVRPLCIGKFGDHYVVASESCALMTIGAEFLREVEPGEIVEITESEVISHGGGESDRKAMCLLEYIYFARPDSMIDGTRLHMARQRMGMELAREHPADADLVIGLPDSATPAAIGYARKSGIPYAEALIKNRYIGRTFIQPDQRLRQQGVALKFNVLPEVVAGKRVVLIDDTIVRGNTSRPIVNLIRAAGATEVHMRVHAPPLRHPCYLGVDLARRDELIAARMSVKEIGDYIGVESIEYLSLEGLMAAIARGTKGFCTGCFTGNYPVPVFDTEGKLALEHA